ncbi:MAG TPA: hypothetical protein EYG85_03490 [Crocinitomix sp.]|nr:hypothetical protein [Crocinitomix sp.]
MTNFFTLIYIKTNRLSDEKICVGIIANFDGVPYFGYSKNKLSMAFKFINPSIVKSIKRSLKILEEDVNKYIRGEESLSLFDMPYSKKILEKFALKKRGIVQYSDMFELNKPIDFDKLYKKYIGEKWNFSKSKPIKHPLTFKQRFFEYVSHKKFNNFSKKYKLTQKDFPNLIAPLTVDILNKSKFYTAFNLVDFNATPTTIQRTITRFKTIIDTLNLKAKEEGLSKGRYYLVYDNSITANNLIENIKNNHKDFELISLTEMRDKV